MTLHHFTGQGFDSLRHNHYQLARLINSVKNTAKLVRVAEDWASDVRLPVPLEHLSCLHIHSSCMQHRAVEEPFASVKTTYSAEVSELIELAGANG